MKAIPRGVYPAAVTPFAGEEFDSAGFERNLERWNRTGLAGYLVLGSNGEGVFLSDDQIVEIVETAARARGDGKFLIVGTGRESTRRTIELTRQAARAGAEAVLVVPPSYYRSAMTDSALEYHYRSIADASDVPLLLYHVPKFSPVSFSAKLVLGLASHPNIAGIKETSGDMALLSVLLKERPPDFRVYIGSGSLLFPSLMLGCDGGILALANVAAEECVAIQQLAEKGELRKAAELQARLLALNHQVTVSLGVAGLKAAMDLRGFTGGECLRPLEPLRAAQREDLRAALSAAGLE
jgi:4-hydroxy-2-oxoglutarate aldolase